MVSEKKEHTLTGEVYKTFIPTPTPENISVKETSRSSHLQFPITSWSLRPPASGSPQLGADVALLAEHLRFGELECSQRLLEMLGDVFAQRRSRER